MMTSNTTQRGGLRGQIRAVWHRSAAVALASLIGLAGCDLDLTNPNAPTEEEVLTDFEGVIALAVGLQSQYADVFTPKYIRAPSLVTDEWSTVQGALPADQSLVRGDPSNTFLVVTEPYQLTYNILRTADALIENAGVGADVPGFESGLTAFAELYKAMALGMAIQHYEQVPVNAARGENPLQPRSVVLDEILSLLESARDALATEPDLSQLQGRVIDGAFSFENTVHAMLARFYLMAERYEDAIAAADQVEPGVGSFITYSDPNRNPIQNYLFELGYAQGRASLVDDAEEGDQRAAFWLDAGAEPFTGIEADIPLLPVRQYTERGDPRPIYLPGEVLLVAAEAHARLGNTDEARDLINRVRTTDTGSGDPGLAPLGGDDLATEDDLLGQIAYERRYELYMQGLRWEDMRRLGEYIDDEPSMMWLPVPQRECLANPAASC